MFAVRFLLLFQLSASVAVMEERFSDYALTSIISNECDDDTSVSRKTITSVIQCGVYCSEERECRRFLYCSSDSSCKLYEDGTDCIMKDDSSSCSCFRKNIGCHGTSCTCPLGFYGDECTDVVKDCREAVSKGIGSKLQNKYRALTYVRLMQASPEVEVQCILVELGGLILLNRRRFCDEDSFNRSLYEYEVGFGRVPYNRWIGLNLILAAMSDMAISTLKVNIYPFNSKECVSYYSNLVITSKSDGYRLYSASYQTTTSDLPCGDSLSANVGNIFSTNDVDNTFYNCPGRLGGGWWFANSQDCTRSFLTGSTNGSTNDIFWLDDLNGELIGGVVVSLWNY